MRNPNEVFLRTLSNTLNGLCQSLTDPVKIDRIVRGVLYSQSLQPDNAESMSAFNVVVLPIYTELVRGGFREDLTVHQLMDAIVEVVVTPTHMQSLRNAREEGRNEETTLMEKLTMKVRQDYEG